MSKVIVNIGILVTTSTGPQDLTDAEVMEFHELKDELFNGDMFAIFSDDVLNSREYKRYDELMKKKLAHLDFYDKVKRAKAFN